MFRYGGNGGNDPETSLFCGIFQFYQCIFVSPVPVDTDQDGPGPLTAQHRQPFHSHSGNTAAVGWHRNDGYILLCQLYRAKILFTVGEIYSCRFTFQRIC